MALDVAADDTSECSDKVIDLTRIRAADSISDADSVDANLVDGSVDGKQVDEVGSERVL